MVVQFYCLKIKVVLNLGALPNSGVGNRKRAGEGVGGDRLIKNVDKQKHFPVKKKIDSLRSCLGWTSFFYSSFKTHIKRNKNERVSAEFPPCFLIHRTQNIYSRIFSSLSSFYICGLIFSVFISFRIFL